ncbi:MAG TPA: hypothetical protein VGL60_05970 [Acidimicrobiales bacterium]
MIHGALITESLRAETTLDGLALVIRRIVRSRPTDTTPNQPKVWTIVYFEADDSAAEHLASTLAGALDTPGWYADFSSASETFVVFAGRVFRYQRGDETGRAEAAAHGRSLGIPESQLDWEA